jgi:bifunctional non-homologous end joining protein LigD
VRAKPGAPVSAPCTWDEIEAGIIGPRSFTLRTMIQRVAEVGDVWSGMLTRKRSLAPAIERLRALIRPGHQ